MTFNEYVNTRDEELYNEYIGSLAGRALGGAAGSMLGPLGTMGGIYAGHYLGDKFDQWAKRTKEKSDLQDPSQKGIISKGTDWLRNKYLAADAWTEKHPLVANLASLGAGAAASYGLHNLSYGGHSDPGSSGGDTSSDGGAGGSKEIMAAKNATEPMTGWNDKVGNYQAWNHDGQRYFQSEDGNIYKWVQSKFTTDGRWSKYDADTDSWGRPSSITDYMRQGRGGWKATK